MVKLSGTASTYLPIGKSVLALQLRAGQVIPLDPRSQTIAPKRFYLGGASTMRGYGEYEMIPEDRRAAAAQQMERCATLASELGCSPELQRRLESGLMVPSEGGEAFRFWHGAWLTLSGFIIRSWTDVVHMDKVREARKGEHDLLLPSLDRVLRRPVLRDDGRRIHRRAVRRGGA